ncbi:MAG: PKD domain-containing protein [Bacteroidota bacterium]|nr:PKD domain-containing protein [Bacteroidota bacterium]
MKKLFLLCFLLTGLNLNLPAEVNFMICKDTIVPCDARFGYYTDSLQPLHIHFWPTGMDHEAIASQIWMFGDGTSSTNFDPWHIYSHSGYYNVCLTLSTIYGTTCSYCDTIAADINYKCLNFIEADKYFLTVNFHGSTESPYPTTYTWEMGDPGSTVRTGQDVLFTYPGSGVYTVTLHTVDSLQCEYTRSWSIGVFATCDLNGFVYADSVLVDHAKVYLYAVDSILRVSLKDSTEISTPNGHYHFGGVLPGVYFTKAELLPSSAYFGSFVPTYHLNAIYMQEADSIYVNPPNPDYNILMAPMGLYLTGPGNINGIVTQGTKINSGGTPVSGVEILLLNTSGEPIGYAVSGSDGIFSFPKIALGSYELYPEYMGKTAVSANITLDGNNSSSDIEFVIKGDKIQLGVNNQLSGDISYITQVYPNPAKDKAYLIIKSRKNIEISLSVFSLEGTIIKENKVNLRQGENILSWDTSLLPEGVYFVKITDGSGVSVARKFIGGR